MSHDPTAIALLTLGCIFLLGLAADILARRTRLPRVTLLLLLGVCIGLLGLDLLPKENGGWFPFIADMALVMVAFLLGGQLTPAMLREHGRAVLVISLVVTISTAIIVSLGLLAFGWPAAVALLLGAIAVSTDPAAVSDVVREARARGPYAQTLLGVVAIDDAWGIATMSIALAFALGLRSPDSASIVALEGLIELGGAIVVGCLLGVPMALLSGRIGAGEPTQAEALGGVLLCGGVALLLDVSFLLAAMTMGVVVTNLARHHRRPFRAIEGIEWPFMVLFFVLSGASIAMTELGSAAALVCGYVVFRVVGRIFGGWLGVVLSGKPRLAGGVGAALLPQAGVAIGLALVVSERVPELGDAILSATVAATILFEILGPVFTRRALISSGEARRNAVNA
jgi:Kef-type K+ transport system membrane component KefB